MYYKKVRRYPRFSVSTWALITKKDGEQIKQLNTRVVTISLGGMGVYTDVSLKKATPVTVELLSYTSDGLTKTDTFEGKIASICSQERDYFVGISFDREISHERFLEILG